MSRLQHRKEGPVAEGADYIRRVHVWNKLRAKGPAAIQAEIDRLWQAIVLRTDVLVEYEILQVQIGGSHEPERTEKAPA